MSELDKTYREAFFKAMEGAHLCDFDAGRKCRSCGRVETATEHFRRLEEDDVLVRMQKHRHRPSKN